MPMILKRPIKVAVAIPKYGLVGGAEGFVFELTERLAENRAFEIHVLANRWRRQNPDIVFHKIHIFPFPRWIKPVSYAIFAGREIEQHGFDIVHSHERIFRTDLLTFHGIPHRAWVTKARRKTMSLFDRATAWVEKKGMGCETLHRILPVSGLVKEELVAAYPQVSSKVSVHHPGVSIRQFRKLDNESCRAEIRRRHGIKSSDVVILFVGMNFGIKRLSLLMRGIAGLSETAKSRVTLLVAGKGDAARYRNLAATLGIDDRVVFAGVVRQMAPYYLAGDIFAMPSRFDTFGMAVLEAMAAGLPVIITRRVGARDLVMPGIHGLLLPAEPLDTEMTAALAMMMDDGNRRRMGENAKKAAREYSWEKVVDRMAILYHEIAGDIDV